jgi:hypothetical protein
MKSRVCWSKIEATRASAAICPWFDDYTLKPSGTKNHQQIAGGRFHCLISAASGHRPA